MENSLKYTTLAKYEQRRYESCHVWHIKNGRMEIITFSQKFHDFYTNLLGQLCKMPKSFNGQRYRCGIYCAFTDHLLVHLCCKQKSQIHRGSIFTFSESLSTVKSNTVFGKITLVALEKYSVEIEENLVYLCFGLA